MLIVPNSRTNRYLLTSIMPVWFRVLASPLSPKCYSKEGIQIKGSTMETEKWGKRCAGPAESIILRIHLN